MSHHRNRLLSDWKDVLAQLRRTETSWRGNSLSDRDHNTYTEAIVLCGLVLDDLSNRYPGLGSHEDHLAWAHTCVHIDVAELAAFLSDAILRFRYFGMWGPAFEQASLTVDYGTLDPYGAFKQSLEERYPFAGTFLHPVSDAIGAHLTTYTSDTFYPVYQFLSFMTHLTLVDLSMADELEEEYLKTEDEVEHHCFPDRLIEQMNDVIRGWFRDFR